MEQLNNPEPNEESAQLVGPSFDAEQLQEPLIKSPIFETCQKLVIAVREAHAIQEAIKAEYGVYENDWLSRLKGTNQAMYAEYVGQAKRARSAVEQLSAIKQEIGEEKFRGFITLINYT
jgi:hypothetical protein